LLNTDPRLNLLLPPPPNQLQFNPLVFLLLLPFNNPRHTTLQPRLLCHRRLRLRLRMPGAMLKTHASALSTKAFSKIISRASRNEVEGHSKLPVHVAVVLAAVIA
jgi:hypothetical protein